MNWSTLPKNSCWTEKVCCIKKLIITLWKTGKQFATFNLELEWILALEIKTNPNNTYTKSRLYKEVDPITSSLKLIIQSVYSRLDVEES